MGAILIAPRNRWSLGTLVVSPLLVGALAELGDMTGALRFFLGLGYLSYGAFLRDLMVAVAYGNTVVPRWPSPSEFWGVGVDAALCCLFALGLWMPAVWLSGPWPEILSISSGVGFCVVGLLLGGMLPAGAAWGAWSVGLVACGLWGAISGMLVNWSRATGPLFLLVSVGGPLIAALLGATLARACAVEPAED